MKFEGKVALITGGASGIGRASARRLASEGATVVIADIDLERGEQTGSELGVAFEALDVRDPVAWADVVEKVCAERGAIDIGVLNAGMLTPVAGRQSQVAGRFDVAALEDADYRQVTSVNIDGIVFGSRAIVRAMAERGGALVATSSLVGIVPFPPDPIYSLTKHAIVGFVRSVAPTLARRNITFNLVCPGTVRTAITTETYFDQMADAGVRVMDPSEIADAIVEAIMSGESGQALVCNGGQPVRAVEFPILDSTRDG